MLLALALVGCSSPDTAAPAEGDGEQAAVAADTMNAAVVTTKLGDAGIEFTSADETEKRSSQFSENNQAALGTLTKFKFGESSVQLSVVDLTDASRQAFVGNDLLSLFNQVVEADASYERGFTITMEDDNTNLLMIFKGDDKAMADAVLAALK